MIGYRSNLSNNQSMSSDNKPRSAFARLFGLGQKEVPDSNEPKISLENEEQSAPNVEPDDSIEQMDSAIENTHSDDKILREADEGSADQRSASEPPLVESVTKSLEHNENKNESPKKGLFASWRNGLGKTRSGLGSAFSSLLGGRRKIDEDLIEEIETILVSADVGIDTTAHLIELFREKVKKGVASDQDLMSVFRELLADLLKENTKPFVLSGNKPDVIMMVGVNGVGKTTSIGKLAKKLQANGKTVMLAAGDTFRAAAVEQLQVWGDRNQVPVVAQATGSDSASVIYDALDSARAKQFDVLIADTAGRLHNKSNLMEELSKVVRVAQKLDETAPHEVLLVLDAATGQNALNQAREFCKAVPITGLILTKLDGTAKGGIVFALVQQLQLPVKFVGLGEGIDDLAEFNPDQFIDALFGDVADAA